jgi:transcriptional regulator with XRE-family HTH domain
MTKSAFLEKLGKNIVRLREGRGLSQLQLADKCRKDKQSINRLEKGRINPSAYYLLQIADAMKVKVKDLFDFD